MISFKELLNGFNVVGNLTISDEYCTAVVTDSRKVIPGSLFVALKGSRFDSHDVLDQVISGGAQAIVVAELRKVPSSFKGFVILAESPRKTLSELASRFYERPSNSLFCIGVTGTNGKTSSTYMLEHLFNKEQRPTGVIGTINHHLQDRVWPTQMTTSDPIDLQERLSDFVKAGAKTLAIEVSSHALDQFRTDSIDFDAAIFTNLTRDHLDYHQSMDHYFTAKNRLFFELLERSNKKNRYAIINTDDSWGEKIIVTENIQRWTFGQNCQDFNFKIKSMTFAETRFDLNSPFGSVDVRLPMAGLHNVYNVVGALAAGCGAGIELESMVASLLDFSGVPGRLQRVPSSKNIHVFVDYAHTPDALENSLRTLKAMNDSFSQKGSLITVFGCGGDRDRGKRPEMAKMAEKYSDRIVVTSDNPRSESPQLIIDEICTGFVNPKYIEIEVDRGLAIENTVRSSKVGDVILIAGKGHEDYQIIGKNKFYFSDFEKAKEALK